MIATCLGSAVASAEDDAVAPPSTQLVISVAEQKLALVRDGGLVRKYPISTSKFGLGDSFNSYKTPLGRMRVCNKIGDGLTLGAVLKSRNATGEILPVNAPGRDPIVTRILWLDGLEEGNANAKSRGIYIHGTVEESKLGQPVSYGCIRMRSRDVVELFEETPVGTPVEIITDRLPRFRRAEPRPEILFASTERPTTPMRVGSHGLVTVKTVRGGEPEMTPISKPAPPTVLFAQAKPTVRTSVATAKAPAEAPLPEKVVEPGPRVVHTPPPPAEPRVVLSMKDSILMAGLPSPVKPAPAQPTPPVPEGPASPRTFRLEVARSVDFFASVEPQRLDELSDLLFNPPTPQFRLAFRANAIPPEL